MIPNIVYKKPRRIFLRNVDETSKECNLLIIVTNKILYRERSVDR